LSFIVKIDYQQFRESQGAFVPDPKVYWLLELSQRHIVTDADNTDAIAVAVYERTTSGPLVVAVDHRFLDGATNTGRFHEEVVFKCGVVGGKADVDVHYDAENIRVFLLV